jgi:hypothetical protein
MTIDDIVSQIFVEHKAYLHPKVIQKAQVKRLIERVSARLQAAKNKENANSINKDNAAGSKGPVKEQPKQAWIVE